MLLMVPSWLIAPLGRSPIEKTITRKNRRWLWWVMSTLRSFVPTKAIANSFHFLSTWRSDEKAIFEQCCSMLDPESEKEKPKQEQFSNEAVAMPVRRSQTIQILSFRFRYCYVLFLRFLYATEWQRTQRATESSAVTLSAALLSLSSSCFKLFIAPIWRRKATKLLSDLPSTGYITSQFLHRMSKWMDRFQLRKQLPRRSLPNANEFGVLIMALIIKIPRIDEIIPKTHF